LDGEATTDDSDQDHVLNVAVVVVHELEPLPVIVRKRLDHRARKPPMYRLERLRRAVEVVSRELPKFVEPTLELLISRPRTMLIMLAIVDAFSDVSDSAISTCQPPNWRSRVEAGCTHI
jgi:hypothetical protein